MSDRLYARVTWKRAVRFYRPLILLVLLAVLLAPLAATAAPEPQGGVYVVQPGDTLSGIAARLGVSTAALASANGIRNTDFVYSGQRLVIPGGGSAPAAQPAQRSSGGTYVVQRGDTLAAIAQRYGVSMAALAAANGLGNTNFIWTGQRLVIPGAATTPANPPRASGGVYVVQPGDTLAAIALRNGTTIQALMTLNGLTNANYVYTGQRLILPGGGIKPAEPKATTPGSTATSGRWIDVNLSRQVLTAFDGNTPVFTTKVSTGLPGTPTVVGTYKIYMKLVSTRMSGPGYDLPNVPYTMYFYGGYGLHGTYWHNNFGHPMSHGCVNLSTQDAAWLFGFASVGTKVVTHY